MKHNCIAMRTLITILLVIMICGAVCAAHSDPVTTAELPAVKRTIQNGLSEEETAEGYIYRAFGVPGYEPRRGSTGRSQLTDDKQLWLYDQLKSLAVEVASGQRESTQFTFPVANVFYDKAYTEEEMSSLWNPVFDVIDALVYDCPYELYWFDKTRSFGPDAGIRYYIEDGLRHIYNYDSATFTLDFPVAAVYSVSGERDTYVFDTAKGQAVQTAVANAQQVKEDNKDLDDIAKLTAYKDWICNEVIYNTDALAAGTLYGDSWQMVSVFDGDDETNVVCEGYSKAFQYLCDQSSFTGNVSAISVTGNMSGGTGGGTGEGDPHMWNIVTLNDGKNYMADITNSDNGTVGAGGGLFLSRYTTKNSDSQYFYVIDENNSVTYTYDTRTVSLFGNSGKLAMEGEEDPVAQGEYTGNGNTVTWSLDREGLLTIEGSGSLTTNGAGWLSYKESILRTEITGNFQGIETGIFKNCSQMTEITLPDNLTGIGYEAFYGCSGLESITMPAGVKNISSFAFKKCSALESVTFLGSGPSTIGGYAFDSCEKLAAFSIPAGVTRIDDGTFNYCSSLTEITIPEGVESIGANAFYGCGLETVTFSGSKLKSIGDFAFKGCISMEEIELPEGLISIGSGAFSGCGLTEIEIPESVESIESGAFSNCEGLTSFSFPTKIKVIYDGVLQDCYNLERVTLQPDTTAIGGYAFAWCNKLTDITIPDTVTTIGSHAFQACSCLTELDIPNGVEEIRENTFAYCGKLESITIPDSVQSIGEKAFLECKSLEAIHIPDGVTTIGSATFSQCYALKEVNIPASVTSIGSSAFVRCEGMTKVTFAENSKLESIGGYAFKQCLSLRELSIPDSVTSIGDWAFSYCRSLTETEIPAGITAISRGLFESCSDLRHVVIPDSVTEIGAEAFKYCGMPDITIPATVRGIGEAAFSNCYYLRSITIPNEVTAIENNTFLYCSGLTAVSLPDSLTGIGQNAFGSCSSLSGIRLPANLENIGSSAFSGCWRMMDITIPDSVTNIGSGAFSGTWDLKKIYIPGAPESIAADAFNHEVTVYCHENTSAWQWATEQTYPIVLLDGKSTDDLLSIQMEKNATILTGRKTGTPYSLFPDLSEVDTEWQSSNENVVTVDEEGLLTPVSVGTATITLRANGLTKTCMVSVRHATEAILVPTDFYVTEGTSAELTPVGLQPADAYASLSDQYEDWTIVGRDYSYSTGWFVKGLKAGETIMTFRDSYTGTTAQVLVHVLPSPSAVRFEPESVSLRAGKTVTLRTYVTIGGEETEGTEYVTFRSADPAIATVTPAGLVTALKEGTVVISADAGGNLTATCEITVRAAETVILPKDIRQIDKGALAGTGAELYIIPAGNQDITIGEDAFAELTAEDIVVRLPANVREIHPNAFRGSDVSLVAPKGSYAAGWAKENGIDCIEE